MVQGMHRGTRGTLQGFHRDENGSQLFVVDSLHNGALWSFPGDRAFPEKRLRHLVCAVGIQSGIPNSARLANELCVTASFAKLHKWYHHAEGLERTM